MNRSELSAIVLELLEKETGESYIKTVGNLLDVLEKKIAAKGKQAA